MSLPEILLFPDKTYRFVILLLYHLFILLEGNKIKFFLAEIFVKFNNKLKEIVNKMFRLFGMQMHGGYNLIEIDQMPVNLMNEFTLTFTVIGIFQNRKICALRKSIVLL